MRKIWTDEEIAFLKENYAKLKTDEILKVLTNKTNDQLRYKAKDFKLKKEITKSKSDMTFLENLNDPEACYWWGFILADGCFNDLSLIISIHENDKQHLEKFCKKAKSKIISSTRINDFSKELYTMVRTTLSDKYTLERIRTRFKIKPQKTYNPFDINELCEKDRILYFLAGIIDGDGYIAVRNNRAISIKVHPNWTQEYKLISAKIKQYFNLKSSVSHNKDGWLVFRMTKTMDIIDLFKYIKDKVPYMERKWDKLIPFLNYKQTEI